uniref:Glucan endo-1,3-beta-D-glucosidase n=1 Tax=Zea mays TaxID=4577 RepID=C0P2J9_MAIZE|nr:unknown [Zea mays]|eukprot:NP_001168141.1 putative O-glycosyl hydrolase family 17 protein [Zea mays]
MATTGSPSRTALPSSPPAPSSCKLAAACCFVLIVPILLTDEHVAVAESLSIGVNYGQIANNLPSPAQVSWLLRSMRVSKVKLYDADPNVLRAFLGTGVEFVVGIGNEYVPAMVSPAAAQAWLQQHVVPYLRSGARITCVTVGNEVFKGNDTALQAAVLPAMQSVHRALGALGLQGRINVTTAHSLDVMGVSFPPSAGAFAPAALAHLQPFLSFLSATRSPFLINCYPYFAYKDDPARVPLDYVLFRPNAGVADARTGLRYDNMLYAQVWTPCTRPSRGSGTRTWRSRCRRPGGRREATPTNPAPRPSTRGPTSGTCCSGSR